MTSNVVSLYSGPNYRSSLNLPLLKANCFRPEGNTSLPSWDKGSDERGHGVCQSSNGDDHED